MQLEDLTRKEALLLWRNLRITPENYDEMESLLKKVKRMIYGADDD